MKALVYYCRWQGAKLRLRGRDEAAVWGQLVFVSDGGEEETQDFHFNLQSSQLTINRAEGEISLVLDEMGVPLDDG